MHEGLLLGYKDFSLCPHLIEGAKGLLRASFIKVLIPWRGLPCGSDRKASAYNAGDLGSIPESGRSSGEGNSNPHQYSCLEKSHGQRILLCYSPWGCKESGTTEQLHFTSLQSHGEFHGQRSLVGSSGVARSPRGHKESDTTEQLIYIKSHVCKIYPHDLSTFQGSHLPSSLLLFSCSVVSGSL